MTYLELDKEMYFLFPAFALGTAASLGLIEPTFLPWINLDDVLLSMGNIDWTIGRVISIVALAAVFINRDTSVLERLGTLEVWVVYVTVGLILAPPIFPAFAETVAETPAAFIAFVAQSMGFAIVTYIN